MPAGDRTGPLGRGPMTGRGAGYCGSGGSAIGFGRGRGGVGRGFGRGYGFRAFETFSAPTREEQLEAMNAQATGLEQQLQRLREEIAKLDAE